MCDDRIGQRRIETLFRCQTLFQIFTRSIDPSRNHYECYDFAFDVVSLRQPFQCVDKQVDALVAIFVTSRCRYQQCFGRGLIAEQGSGDSQQTFPGMFAAFSYASPCGTKFSSNPFGVTISGLRSNSWVHSRAVMSLTVVKQSACNAACFSIECFDTIFSSSAI